MSYCNDCKGKNYIVKVSDSYYTSPVQPWQPTGTVNIERIHQVIILKNQSLNINENDQRNTLIIYVKKCSHCGQYFDDFK
jgi:hypothetical protein